jgi:REP element-mobilizing transposase RayT
MQRKIEEVNAQILRVAVCYLTEVQSEDEMRFLLLEKDLDNRDALNMIYDNNLVELIKHPFAQNIVHQIWTSPYNNSQSMFSASSVHTLLWNYNHCRFDMEAALRFYRKRNLQTVGCHGFQFQVWRFAA